MTRAIFQGNKPLEVREVMEKRSLLLAVDGSAESLMATDVSWLLARQTHSSVTAQHVIDTFAAWKLLSYSSSGLLNVAAYFDAYENICVCLRHLGMELAQSYKSRAAAHGIKSEIFLDEGNTVKEICKRAADNDLLIIGHRSYTGQFREDLISRPRRSLCEELVQVCQSPMLIVQNKCQKWSTIRILIGNTRYSSESIAAMLKVVRSLAPKVEVYHSWHFANEREEIRFKQQFSQHITKLQTITFAFEQPLATNKARLSDMEVGPDTLVLTPIVVQQTNGRRTCHGADLQKFLRCLELPAILLCPCQTYFESGKGECETEKRSTA
jgi:nucleotide-binding universal stress UspA family protein